MRRPANKKHEGGPENINIWLVRPFVHLPVRSCVKSTKRLVFPVCIVLYSNQNDSSTVLLKGSCKY